MCVLLDTIMYSKSHLPVVACVCVCMCVCIMKGSVCCEGNKRAVSKFEGD